jgi:hypothetical protein
MAGTILRGSYKKFDLERSRNWVKDNLTWKQFGDSMMEIFKKSIEESR